MSGMNRRKGGRRSGTPRQSPSLNAFVRKNDMKGYKITPPTNPPDTTIQPWYPYVIVDTFTGSFNYTVANLAGYFRKRIDPNGWGLNPSDSGAKPFRVQFRVQSIFVWNLTGKFITLSVEDYADAQSAKGGRDQLCGLIDSGTQLHTPAVGYKLPFPVSSIVLRNDDLQKDIYVFHSQAGSGDLCLMHAHVLWRFDGPSIPPTLTIPPSNTSDEAVSSGINDLKDIAKRLEEISIDNRNNRPSTVRKVIDNAARLALLVATGGEELSNSDIDFLSDTSAVEGSQ